MTVLTGRGDGTFQKPVAYTTGKNPAALMSAWDAGLRDIARQISAEYAKARSTDGGR